MKVLPRLLIALLIAPIWLLTSRAISYVGLPCMRMRKGALELPVVYYEHPASGRKVALICVIHIAEPQYYAAIQQLLDELGNHAILFEGTGKLTDEQKVSLTSREQVAAAEMAMLFELVKFLRGTTELQGQLDALKYSPSWIRTDTTQVEIVKKMAREDLHFFRKKMPVLPQSEAGKKVIRWFVNRVLQKMPAHAVLFYAFALLSRKKRALRRIILTERNEIAFCGIQKHLEEGNVATIWGAAHMMGIQKHLKGAGFRIVKKVWYPAYHSRPYELIPAYQEFVAEMKAEKRQRLKTVL